MATTVTRGTTGNIGKEDLNIQSSSTETFSRTGTTLALTKVGRHTLNTREYDVMQWGAVGDGTTDDTAAIQAAITEAQTAGGGMIVFPAGYTFKVVRPTAILPCFALSSGNLTFSMYGATIKVVSTAALQPTTTANEKRFSHVFKATGCDNITFLGGTFDGNRDDTHDPRCGFFLGVKSSNVVVRDMVLKNVNHCEGAIVGNGWDATDSSAEQIANWNVSGNRFEQSMRGVMFIESMRNITVDDNDFVNMDLGPSAGSSGPSYTPTYYSATTTDRRTLRPLVFNGFVSSTFAAGVIRDIAVTNNRIMGGAWSIELQNQFAGAGKNPQYAHNINVSGNTIWGTHGISVNDYSAVEISNNVITLMKDADLATYAGRMYNAAGAYTAGVLTAVPYGHGIEAVPNYGQIISGNTIDGGWTEAAPGGSPTGISVGGDESDYAITADVVGNTIRRCYRGIGIGQMENSLIGSNKVAECRTAIETVVDSETDRNLAVGFTWKGNVLSGNTAVGAETGASAVLVKIDGSWTITGNTFIGRVATQQSGFTLLFVGGFASTYGGTVDISDFVITNNTFRRFKYWAIRNRGTQSRATLRMHLDGNIFDSEQSGPDGTTAAFRVDRPAANYAPVITAGQNHAARMLHPINIEVPTLWVTGTVYALGTVVYYTASGVIYTCTTAHTAGATFAGDSANWTALTETYDFGQWTSDGTFTALWKNSAGGVAITGGTPIVGFGPRRKAVHVRTNSGAATVDVASFFPAESLIVGVRGEITTTITMGGGGTTWSLGCPFWMNGTQLAHTSALTNGNTDAWGTGLALTAGTDIEPSTWRTPPNSFTTNTAAATLRLTANTGTFTDGYVTLILDYLPLSEDII